MRTAVALAAALLVACSGTGTNADIGAYVTAARPILSNMTDAQIEDIGHGTCERLSDNWTMENAAAAMMDAGAGTGTVLDYLDVLTEHACPDHRAAYNAWVADLASR